MDEKKKKSAMEKIMEGLDAPANFISSKVAEATGVEKGADSEETYFNAVDAAAQKMGIPEDSDVGNAAKALAVAGMTYAADPIPFGKYIKAGRRGMKAAKKVMPYIKRGDNTAKAYGRSGALVKETAQEKMEREMKEAGRRRAERAAATYLGER